MWSTQHSERTSAKPADVWARWSHVAGWTEWDEGIEWASIDGPLVTGATGRLKPKGGPATRFRITHSEPEVGFADETRLPLARLRFEHRLAPLAEVEGGGTTITHSVTIDGPLAPLFGRLIGRGIEKDLPDTLGRLAALAAV